MLYYATLANNSEVIRELLQRDGSAGINKVVRDVSLGEQAFAPLHNALAYGSFEVVRQLLEAKADPKLPGMLPPLTVAANFSKHANVKLWLEHFGNSDLELVEISSGTTPLMFATRSAGDGGLETVQ